MPEWLDYKLNLESELNLQQGLRAIQGATDLDELKETAMVLCHNWFQTKHLLRQHIRRVVELESRIGFEKFLPSSEGSPDLIATDPHTPKPPASP